MVRIAASLQGRRAYLVGGVVRDLLLGVDRADIDIVVEGQVDDAARRLGGAVRVHRRFETASVVVEGFEVDFARARTETYAYPGALPDVSPATLDEDLRRRDFTINAMAWSLDDHELIDPLGGYDDLAEGVLRILHPHSFEDDPTRALRASRYVARYGLEVEGVTASRLAEADLRTISSERIEAELRKMAAEDSPRPVFEWAAKQKLVVPGPKSWELIDEVVRLTAAPPWRGFAPRPEAVLAAALGRWGRKEARLAEIEPERPSRAVSLVRGLDSEQLLLARALGAEWLDRYVARWRFVRPEISGRDLLAAGIPEGQAVGLGLKAAFEAKLDGETESRGDELAIALEVARRQADGRTGQHD